MSISAGRIDRLINKGAWNLQETSSPFSDNTLFSFLLTEVLHYAIMTQCTRSYLLETLLKN